MNLYVNHKNQDGSVGNLGTLSYVCFSDNDMNILLGKLLTLADAILEPGQRLDAYKSLIRQTVRNRTANVANDGSLVVTFSEVDQKERNLDALFSVTGHFFQRFSTVTDTDMTNEEDLQKEEA